MRKNTLKVGLFILFSGFSNYLKAKQPPRVTVIFVVDQLAHFYLPRLKNHFTDGFKILIDQGVNYTNAYFPHGMPSTATGHAGLATGTYAKDHGIIGNGWFDEKGEYIHCDDDPSKGTEVFSEKSKTYAYGKSPHQIMVDGISDRFIASSFRKRQRYAYSVSLKGRASILTAGKKGKAFWFDNKTGKFTTSKAYYKKYPDWLEVFNNNQAYRNDDSIIWKSLYPACHNAYDSVKDVTYKYARYDFKLIDKNIAPQVQKETDRPYDLWVKTPFANQAVLDLGRVIFDKHISKNNNNEILLWVCLSSLDKLGHFYGPDSQEVIDMIYQLDRQVGEFMKYVQSVVGHQKALFVLTSDHGIMPFVEVLQQGGSSRASRVSISDLQTSINSIIETKYGLKSFLTNFKVPQFYINKDELNKLNVEKKEKLFATIKKNLLKNSGVKNVWTFEELSKACFEPQQIENYYKMQLYPGRSGEIIVQSAPHSILTSATKGTSHKNPYEDNTHVPLILYQPDSVRNGEVAQRVWALQLANTLADIINIPKPSASRFEILPGIFDKKLRKELK